MAVVRWPLGQRPPQSKSKPRGLERDRLRRTISPLLFQESLTGLLSAAFDVPLKSAGVWREVTIAGRLRFTPPAVSHPNVVKRQINLFLWPLLNKGF